MDTLNIALDELKSRVDAKVAELERMFPHTIRDAIRPSDSTYLFAKGHAILTNVVLSSPAAHLEKLASLKGAALPVETRNQLLSKQKNARLSIDKLIHANTEFKTCTIKADLDLQGPHACDKSAFDQQPRLVPFRNVD
ncbi:MAG: hypothetical protein IPN95_16535 [Bacteroidetes bacterium]|nr:hypothetical protein [Bacteroidota bacterium]